MNSPKTNDNPYADALYFIAFWIAHNYKKAKHGYLVKDETIKQLSEGKMPTL